MASKLGTFVLSHSIRIMNKFVIEIDGFYSNKVHYQDTGSLYIHMDEYGNVKQAFYVGNSLGQGENDFGDGGTFYGLFLESN